MFKRIQSISTLRSVVADWRSQGLTVGFVPTMGFLHDGHGSLLARAREENDIVVLSIFVNPLQFNEESDYDVYPHDLERDDAVAAAHSVDVVFNPSVDEMYPTGVPKTAICVSGITEPFEGAHRPGHFDGVALVVTKLLNIVEPTRAYFGEKDHQQLAVVRQLVADLSMRCEIVGCPIVRDKNGLALSSRNALLSPEQIETALTLSEALKVGEHQFFAGETDPNMVLKSMRELLEATPNIEVDYVAAVNCDTLLQPDVLSTPFQLLLAATIGDVRLIDTCRVGD